MPVYICGLKKTALHSVYAHRTSWKCDNVILRVSSTKLYMGLGLVPGSGSLQTNMVA